MALFNPCDKVSPKLLGKELHVSCLGIRNRVRSFVVRDVSLLPIGIESPHAESVGSESVGEGVDDPVVVIGSFGFVPGDCQRSRCKL